MGVFNLMSKYGLQKEGPCSTVLDERLKTTAENRDEAKE